MSNASLFRRAAFVETLMLNRVMPKTAEREAAAKPRPIVERRPAPLTVSIRDRVSEK